MKIFIKKFLIVICATLIFCSCSTKQVKLEQLSGKYFVTKEKILFIVGKKDVEKFSDLKENDLAMLDVKDMSVSKIFKNVKISKKDGKEFIVADNLDLHLEILNDKTIKDVENNIEYKEYKQGEIPNNLDSTNKVEITKDIKNIANKSFTSDLGVQIIFALTENGETNLFIKENGKETHYSNANLKQENGKTYITANGLKNKFIYSSINKIIDEDTKIEYKLNNQR